MAKRTTFWLAEADAPWKLVDGPHSERAGVEQALYLISGMGMRRGRQFVCVEATVTDVKPIAHDVDHEALAACRDMVAADRSR